MLQICPNVVGIVHPDYTLSDGRRDEMNKPKSHHIVVVIPCKETSIIWFWLKVVLDNKIDFILGTERC